MFGIYPPLHWGDFLVHPAGNGYAMHYGTHPICWLRSLFVFRGKREKKRLIIFKEHWMEIMINERFCLQIRIKSVLIDFLVIWCKNVLFFLADHLFKLEMCKASPTMCLWRIENLSRRRRERHSMLRLWTQINATLHSSFMPLRFPLPFPPSPVHIHAGHDTPLCRRSSCCWMLGLGKRKW